MKRSAIRAACCAGAMLAVVGCSNPASDTKSVEDAVRAQAAGLLAAYNVHDAVKAASNDAADYVGMFHGTANTVGQAADEAGMKAQLSDPAASWVISNGKVTVASSGDLAVYEGDYVFTATNPATGQPLKEAGNWIAIFKRQADGTMKLWRSIGTDTPAVPKA